MTITELISSSLFTFLAQHPTAANQYHIEIKLNCTVTRTKPREDALIHCQYGRKEQLPELLPEEHFDEDPGHFFRREIIPSE